MEWTTLSTADLREAGRKARDIEGTVVQNCGDVVDTFLNILIDDHGLAYDSEAASRYRRRHVRVGPNGEEKHYIFELDGVFVEGYDAGTALWVDLSFDQFAEEHKEDGVVKVAYGKRDELDAVRIMPPSDPRRTQQYQTVGTFLS